MWWIYALLAGAFAGAPAVLATVGGTLAGGMALQLAASLLVAGGPVLVRDHRLGGQYRQSELATTIRGVVILVVVWGLLLLKDHAPELSALSLETWGRLGLAALAAGLSWMFCFHALQVGSAARVTPARLGIVLVLALSTGLLGQFLPLPAAVGIVLVGGGAVVLLL